LATTPLLAASQRNALKERDEELAVAEAELRRVRAALSAAESARVDASEQSKANADALFAHVKTNEVAILQLKSERQRELMAMQRDLSKAVESREETASATRRLMQRWATNTMFLSATARVAPLQQDALRWWSSACLS
jgi:hypothetical protein